MAVELILNYKIIEKLGESPQSTIYKAYNKKNPGKPLILKILKTGYLPEHQKLHFRQKIEQLKVLNDPLLIRPLAFEAKEELQFIVRDYFEGIPLNKWAKTQGTIYLNDFFTIACLLAQALYKVHGAGIIHGGIKPNNILVLPESLQIRLIDFITSLDVREISHFIYERSFVEGTLAYTSPEQTGRINHRVDFSSDLYSLGIVFYELLTGKLPFFSLDPLELIHSHLAEEAANISQIKPETPEMLSRIISMLMLKQPEKRYQSATGLLRDLEHCRNEYMAKARIPEFPLARYDYTHRVTFISKMVGRSTETKLILGLYNHTAGGNFRSLFISGLPGIGKTRLIQELQKPIVEHKGYFTSGKFDFYQKNIPYSALIQGLRNLIRTFLTESDERVERWKQKILYALGNNGKALTDVIPELEILIGKQPEIQALPPIESRNRFNYIFDKFLSCLASEENPLTFFIDDLQWCDSATFDFFENIFANYKGHSYLLLIGAYRSNEVGPAHPLIKLIRRNKENKRTQEEVELTPLLSAHSHEMVSYILDSALDDTEELSAFIADLASGNPLFVSETLSYLHNENLLFLDENRHWHWDINKIRESDMPPTVVALFSSKVQKLPLQTIEILEYCACMGNRFSPTEISLIKETPLISIFKALKYALAQGLLMENKDDLQFVHDRVQEAVLSKITSDKKLKIHWTIGSHLLSAAAELKELEKLDNLFSLTAHLNLGKPKTLDIKTAYLLSDINYHAGNKALDALATEAANEYFKLAREFLPEDSWESQYEKTFKIYQKSAKTELMSGNYDKSEQLLNQLLNNAKTELDKAESLAEQTTSLSSIGNFNKAIETANKGLNYFDKSIPQDTVTAEKKCGQLMLEIEAKNIDVWDTILNMPLATERKSKIELAFYSELIPDLYMSGLVPQLYLSAVQSTLHCLEGGMEESVIYSFSIMGLYLGEKEEFEKAFKYEDLAHNLCEKYPNTFGATRGMNGIVWCNMHSRSRPEEIVNYCLKSIQCGKNSGDLYNAGLSYGPLMWNLQVEGRDFKKIEEYANECLEFSNKYHLYFSVRLAEAMQASWIEPMKKNYIHTSIDEKLKLWEKDNHIAAIGSYYVHMGLMHYYFDEYEEAENYLQNVNRYLTGLTDNVLKRLWHIFLVLNALSLHSIGVKYKNKEELFAYIQPLIQKIETWASLGPLLKPYLAFLYAELKRIRGDLGEARSQYLDTLDFVHKHKYAFLEAHISECLGNLLEKSYYSEKNGSVIDKGTAGVFFKEAARLYKKCNAERKEISLLEKHPEYFEEELPLNKNLADLPTATLPNIDINYLIKSCLIIPIEMEEETLLHRIMNVVLESSGAQHGYLIMEEGNDLIIRAESHVTEKNTVRTTSQKFEDFKDIAHAIIRYVHRTKEIVLLENAVEKGDFKDNLEVQEMKLRSVLCLPVIKQNKLIGILYLENRLSDSVFTAERTDLTKLLTYEAAISLENARLIEKMKQTEEDLKRHREHLEEMVKERTKQLTKAQEELLIAERLAVLGQLAGSISHEIRNPLNVINSSAYFIKMKLGQKDRKLKEHIEHIESEVKNSTAIIDSILSLSGIKEPRKEHLNLVTALNNALSNFVMPDSVKVKKDISETETIVYADRNQLFIVFHNIIKNALQAMNNKGTIFVKMHKNDNQSVEISFIDTGCGISPENMEKLFQPLFTTKARGFGFGLLICKMIVDKHNGIISIKSEPGKGANVSITLPLSVK